MRHDEAGFINGIIKMRMISPSIVDLSKIDIPNMLHRIVISIPTIKSLSRIDSYTMRTNLVRNCEAGCLHSERTHRLNIPIGHDFIHIQHLEL